MTDRPPLKRILRRRHMLKAPGAGVVAPEEVFGGCFRDHYCKGSFRRHYNNLSHSPWWSWCLCPENQYAFIIPMAAIWALGIILPNIVIVRSILFHINHIFQENCHWYLPIQDHQPILMPAIGAQDMNSHSLVRQIFANGIIGVSNTLIRFNVWILPKNDSFNIRFNISLPKIWFKILFNSKNILLIQFKR